MEVAAGSVVLFDANLLHAAWENTDSGSSERVAFHYIPVDVESEFRGISFARGVFADRHEAMDPKGHNSPSQATASSRKRVR